jgi:hypothetical protein
VSGWLSGFVPVPVFAPLVFSLPVVWLPGFLRAFALTPPAGLGLPPGDPFSFSGLCTASEVGSLKTAGVIAAGGATPKEAVLEIIFDGSGAGSGVEISGFADSSWVDTGLARDA